MENNDDKKRNEKTRNSSCYKILKIYGVLRFAGKIFQAGCEFSEKTIGSTNKVQNF